MARKKYKISTDDYHRVLITETLPYEVPLIFSNDGLYEFYKFIDDKCSKKVPDVILKIMTNGNNKNILAKKPFNYKISKDIHSVRILSLIHPIIQKSFVDFYKKNDSLINYYCSKSEFSIRYPKKVSSTVYESKNNETYQLLLEEIEHDSTFKNEKVELVGEDKKNRFSSNYFSYKKFEILYKFFDSIDFIKLEKKFSRMSCIDVTSCFDSIYTHSISWAVKNKKYIKENLNVNSPKSFDDDFDYLIRSANHNETNGIVIGPEFSRIFAEIILQKIDNNIESELLSKKLIHNRDYCIRRYLDDFFIFTKSESIENIIKSIVVEKLLEYKLRINLSKSKSYIRPFITERSRNIGELREKINKLDDLFFKIKDEEENEFLKIKKIFNPLKMSAAFIKEIKICWYSNESLHTSFSNYILSTLLSKYITFVQLYEKHRLPPEHHDFIVNFSIFTLDIAHYCLSLEPRVSPSYKFCQLVIVMNRFANRYIPEYSDKLNHKIQENLLILLKNELSEEIACGIEKYNILLTLANIDRRYLPKNDLIENLIFSNEEQINYFNIVTALFIASNDSIYDGLIQRALLEAHKIFDKEPSVYSSTETIHLFLDLMSCPYINEQEKQKFAYIIIDKLNQDASFKDKIGSQDIRNKATELYEFTKNRSWFVNWKDLDLLLKLQRKQLRESY